MINSLRSLSSLVLVVGFFTSCLNNSSSPAPSSAIIITHASPDAPNLDMYVDGGLSLSNLPYGTDTGYLAINPGTFQFDFTQNGSTTSLLTHSVPFESNKFY